MDEVFIEEEEEEEEVYGLAYLDITVFAGCPLFAAPVVCRVRCWCACEVGRTMAFAGFETLRKVLIVSGAGGVEAFYRHRHTDTYIHTEILHSTE